MAKIQKRTWLGRGPTSHKVRKVAWGYTLQVGRKQERKYRSSWCIWARRTSLPAGSRTLSNPPGEP